MHTTSEKADAVGRAIRVVLWEEASSSPVGTRSGIGACGNVEGGCRGDSLWWIASILGVPAPLADPPATPPPEASVSS